MIDKDTFLSIAKASGVEMSDSHLQALYAYVEKLFPSIKVTEGMDLTEIEPMLTVVFPKE
jgi:Asp-tRNA(Asn)/Glu-tRNA(Gln) amidotransferase C subunit